MRGFPRSVIVEAQAYRLPLDVSPVPAAMPDTPSRSDPRVRRSPTLPSAPTPRTDHRPASEPRSIPDDRFFSHVVSSMRNGVNAVRRDGTIALMNNEGYRIFGLTPSAAEDR